MYNCFDIAKQFLKLAKDDGLIVEPMKLLKLTYIAHGWYLGFFDKPLFSNSVQAWKYGPVIPELYHVTKRFGQGNVDIEIVDLYTENKLSSADKSFIKTLWNRYKGFSGLQLSTKTHMKDTPWDEAYDPLVYHKVISNELIKEHYKKLINERN